jgi:P27 family predicted phage terminase small subunit
MGSRGPAPQPTKLKLVRGETRPSRINYLEPIPARSDLNPPEDLTEEARQIWHSTVAAVGHTGVLTAADTQTLRLYAEATARYRTAETMLAKTGPLIKGRNGELVKNPLHQIVRDNATLMRSLARELGLTPASRTGLRSDLDAEANDAQGKLSALLAAARRAG